MVAFPFHDRLIAHQSQSTNRVPFITVAIPHYQHRRYLALVLESVFQQMHDDFEIVVSDDRSPDDSSQVVPQLLYSAGRPFRYYAQPVNLGYDGNVRFCLKAALGRYVFLLGNDDALGGPATLYDVAAALQQLNLPEVAFTNFEDWSTGNIERRAASTCLLGQGVETAVRYFRSFSFVSGLLFDQAAAVRYETDRWDRSVFYQIYLATRLLAAGGRLGALEISAVRKDVRLNGQTAPNYTTIWAGAPWSFQPRQSGVESAVRVAIDGVQPYAPTSDKSRIIRRMLAQVLTVTYPYWLVEYRHVANWSFAIGIARGLWPSRLLAEYSLSAGDRGYLWVLYGAATLAGLFIPVRWFNAIKPRLANVVRRKRQTNRSVQLRLW